MKKNIAKAMHEREMIKSLSEARRLILMSAIKVNGKVVVSLDEEVEDTEKIEIVKRKK